MTILINMNMKIIAYYLVLMKHFMMRMIKYVTKIHLLKQLLRQN